MWRNRFWEWMEQYSGYVFGPMLMGLSLVLGHYVAPIYPNRLMDEFIVALMIAGILTTTVDPFMKRRARREATRDIFHHMLGFSLPEVIRERLQKLVETTKIYRRGTSLHIVMSEEGDLVVFDVEMEFEMVNPTPHAFAFSPHLQFEKGELALLRSVTCFEEPDCGVNAKLSPSNSGLGSVEFQGKVVNIPAGGGSLRFKYEYVVKYPAPLGFWYPNFQYPTIGLGLTVKHPSNFIVKATSAENESSGEWRYPNKLFMPGEHLDIVWDKLG
jgi:hypothetical protein